MPWFIRETIDWQARAVTLTSEGSISPGTTPLAQDVTAAMAEAYANLPAAQRLRGPQMGRLREALDRVFLDRVASGMQPRDSVPPDIRQAAGQITDQQRSDDRAVLLAARAVLGHDLRLPGVCGVAGSGRGQAPACSEYH